MLATPNDYYLIDRIYIYTESFKIEGLSENEKMMLMTIVLGHEMFIHYNSEVVELWSCGEYDKAIQLAQKDRGPNNGDNDHRDYINGR